jgi:mono/diheme cytochrome c family protein
MVNRPEGWTGYTYRWRADQSDADLLTTGATAAYDTVNPATGAATRIDWTFPTQAQCLNCHTLATGRVLGINARQLNGSHTYQSTGNADNQLRTLNHIGIFSSDIGEAAQYAAMPAATDASASLEARAKSYLDTNCSICHLPGGPTPVAMDLRYSTAVAGMQLVGVANQGSVGGVRVAAGNHAGSLLWTRAASTAANVRMPPLGVQMVDEAGLQVLANWIDSLR